MANYKWGTGRRKTAVARVRVRTGSGGSIMVNDREMEEYFPREDHRLAVRAPLKVTGNLGNYEVLVNVNGGGLTGQSEAIQLGIARALVNEDPEYYDELRDNGLLTRDSRMKERKKPGKRGARRSPQYSKR